MSEDRERLQLHINLWHDQVQEYELVQEYLGIQNHNDLVRYLVRQEAHRIRGLAPQVAMERARVPVGARLETR